MEFFVSRAALTDKEGRTSIVSRNYSVPEICRGDWTGYVKTRIIEERDRPYNHRSQSRLSEDDEPVGDTGHLYRKGFR